MEIAEIFLTSGNPTLIASLGDMPGSQTIRIADAKRLLSRAWDRPAAIFIDWILPDMAGIELVRQLRALPTTQELHITLVLDASAAEDRRRALAAGADDYLVGALSADILRERLARLCGGPPPRSPTLRLGSLEVDPSAYSAAFEGRTLPLRVNEMNLLIHFARRPNRVFSRNELIGALGKGSAVGDERTVDVWVSRLRRSLARHGVPHQPRTVRALGYVMDAPQC